MSLGLVFIIGFTPGLFWLWVVYTRDRCEREPLSLVIRTFLLGILVAAPIAIVEYLLYPNAISDTEPLPLGTAAYLSFVVAGLTEEVGKFSVVGLTVYRSPHFNESMDGLVYSAAVALGFASLENVGYIARYGALVMLLRAPISTFGHVIFSSFWGYPLALRKVGRGLGSFGVVLGLVIAIAFHGIFNFINFAAPGLFWLSFLLIAAGAVIFILMVIHARRVSPYCKFLYKKVTSR